MCVQHQVVGEGICAMLGLVVLDTGRELAGRAAVWAALTHPEKHVLLHDRVLAAQPDDGNYHITTFYNNTVLTCMPKTHYHSFFLKNHDIDN